mmetsp:Transcript_15413/g.20411  ORF Transcript_15413/g.20411 Transcript_15413/m.20411 type:complete len:391 (-) Transcript_15413:882-2054(-)
MPNSGSDDDCGADWTSDCTSAYQSQLSELESNMFNSGAKVVFRETTCCGGRRGDDGEFGYEEDAISEQTDAAEDYFSGSDVTVSEAFDLWDRDDLDDATTDGIHPNLENCLIINKRALKALDDGSCTGSGGGDDDEDEDEDENEIDEDDDEGEIDEDDGEDEDEDNGDGIADSRTIESSFSIRGLSLEEAETNIDLFAQAIADVADVDVSQIEITITSLERRRLQNTGIVVVYSITVDSEENAASLATKLEGVEAEDIQTAISQVASTVDAFDELEVTSVDDVSIVVDDSTEDEESTSSKKKKKSTDSSVITIIVVIILVVVLFCAGALYYLCSKQSTKEETPEFVELVAGKPLPLNSYNEDQQPPLAASVPSQEQIEIPHAEVVGPERT